MKKIALTLIAALATVFSFAQELRQGTIMVKSYPQGSSEDVKTSYIIEDSNTKELFESEPSSLNLVVGQQVDYTLRQLSYHANNDVLHGRWDGNYSDGQNPSAWNAYDGTCQEMSDGRCQCGPASIPTLEDAEMVTNMQKSRHDAMMATIQNAR